MEKRAFGKMPDGQEVFSFTLTNQCGAVAQVINVGAVVQSLTLPDRAGRLQDVVLGCNTVDDYVTRSPFFGAIVGRYGNRIAYGRFSLDGKAYVLNTNNGQHHLHGGVVGFDKRYWALEEAVCKSGAGVRAVIHSPDGEEGYPGSVTLELIINLTDENELRFDYFGTCDKPTLLNPTHHSYFNLSGDPNTTILDHLLQIDADAFTPTDSGLIPTGEIQSVQETPMDFRDSKPVGCRIDNAFDQLEHGGGYDHNFVLNHYEKGVVRNVARLYHARSGRWMEVHTDQPGMQLYSGNFLDSTLKGKDGVAYPKRSGLCLEAQCYPDSPNQHLFPSAVLRPGGTYRQTTIYKFGTD